MNSYVYIIIKNLWLFKTIILNYFLIKEKRFIDFVKDRNTLSMLTLSKVKKTRQQNVHINGCYVKEINAKWYEMKWHEINTLYSGPH